jgi:hypothetical protein
MRARRPRPDGWNLCDKGEFRLGTIPYFWPKLDASESSIEGSKPYNC